ncbi:MAG: hypothetical protein IJB77_05565 [Bacteroidaceae bacterium]|nr:hypothetical protein [Bacteroidaceae bacterium]
MKKAYLYCDKRSLNDATYYYIDIIKECIVERGYDFILIHKLSEIKSPDLIFTITGRYFLYAKLKFPFVKTIYWAQGVGAEEAKMNGVGTFKSKLRYIFRYAAESLAVNCADTLFVVSEKMKEFFSKEYGYNEKKNNCIVMPCFNLEISPDFDLSQYEKPTFVYAGSASVWQCVDKMLTVFSMLEKRIKDAKLVILSSDKETFEKSIAEHNIKNYEIKYIPYKELNKELHKYKYGFLLREDHIVNNVATPTKMNSYLSNFIIPIYSDAVDDFARNVKIGEYTIMAKCPLNETEICNQIFEFETSEHDFSTLKTEIENIFENHYNKDKYKSIIQTKFISLGL